MRRLLNVRPRGGGLVILGLLPLIIVVLLYLSASAARHIENPRDKVLPTAGAMAEAVVLMSQVDPLRDEIPLAVDTVASLRRLAIALAVSTVISLSLGLLLGLLPIMRGAFGPLVGAVAVIPPIAILPILFIIFGLGETAKIALIVIGITPVMVRDLASHISAIPEEQMVKAQTLGASTWQVALRVAVPQALPRLIKCLRLSLGPAWVFLISAEAIAADVGLGYRIFLVRRYLAMDVILPYVAWISVLAVLMDLGLLAISKRFFAWAHPKGAI